MRVLTIGTDKRIFEDGSSTQTRIISYGAIVEELHIICFTKKGFKEKKISPNVRVYPTNSISKIFWIWDALSFSKVFLSKKIDIVSAQDPFESGLVAFFMASKLKAKLHIQIHTDFLSPYFFKESFLNKIRVAIAKFLLPRADGIRTVSKRINDSLKANSFKLKAVPVVLPIRATDRHLEKRDSDFLRKKYPTFQSFTLMVGRLEKEKNVSLAIKSFAEVCKSFENTALVIVGDGSLKESLKKQVKFLQIENKVFFEGWREELQDYYQSASIFLHTSNYEGYGLVLFEAAVAGLPIVSTNVGIAEEMQSLGSAVFLADSDKNKLSSVIKKAFERLPEAREKALEGKEILSKTLVSEEEYLKRYKLAWEKCLW